jgi:hypothetical protein
MVSTIARFIEAFTHVYGNDARVADLGLSVAAVLCAYAWRSATAFQ